MNTQEKLPTAKKPRSKKCLVTMVTGKINSGKTTFLLTHYQEQQKGDGFISLKTVDGNVASRYSSMCLSTKVIKPWMTHNDYYHDEFIKETQIGPYHMNLLRLAELETAIETMILNKVQPIYLDEIGRLELSDQGYHNILKKMIASNLEIIITVREDLVDLVKDHYGIKECLIIPVKS